MTAPSMGRIVVPVLALVAAACGAALVFGVTHVGRGPSVETRAATAAPAMSPLALGAGNEGSAALAAAQAEASAVAAGLATPPRSPPDADESVPIFDIARIERTGDAVIAGRAAPGSTVELLRNGERHDRAVVNQSGQFVMVPPRLPAGNYELTLRSRQPDGKEATSKQSVVVALDDATSSSGALGSSQAQQPSQLGVSKLPFATAAAVPTDEGPQAAAVVPKVGTTVVSRGDSLWRISRVTYGSGMRYAVVYKANRDRIRNPDRIYPGQVFVLPMKAR
jgi:nucleoid-associated protein YgaU